MKRTHVSRAELATLSFCNSDRLSGPVEVDGRSMRWVGIGWIDEGSATGKELLVVEKKPRKPRKRLPVTAEYDPRSGCIEMCIGKKHIGGFPFSDDYGNLYMPERIIDEVGLTVAKAINANGAQLREAYERERS